MPRRTLVKERRGGAVKLPHIKGEVCWGWVSLLVLFSATERSALPLATEGTQEKDSFLVLFKKDIFQTRKKISIRNDFQSLASR